MKKKRLKHTHSHHAREMLQDALPPAVCGLQVSLLPALALSVMEGKNAPPDIAVLALDVDELESFQEQRGIESWIDYEKAAGQKFTAKYDK